MSLDKTSMLTCIDTVITLLQYTEKLCQYRCRTIHTPHSQRERDGDGLRERTGSLTHDTASQPRSSPPIRTIAGSIGVQLQLRVAVCIMNLYLHRLTKHARIVMERRAEWTRHSAPHEPHHARCEQRAVNVTNTTKLEGCDEMSQRLRGDLHKCGTRRSDEAAEETTTTTTRHVHSPCRGGSLPCEILSTDPHTFTRGPLAASSSSFSAYCTPLHDRRDTTAPCPQEKDDNDTWRPMHVSSAMGVMKCDMKSVSSNTITNAYGMESEAMLLPHALSENLARTCEVHDRAHARDTVCRTSPLPCMSESAWTALQTPCRLLGPAPYNPTDTKRIITPLPPTPTHRTPRLPPHGRNVSSPSPASSCPRSTVSQHSSPLDSCLSHRRSRCPAAPDALPFALSLCGHDTCTRLTALEALSHSLTPPCLHMPLHTEAAEGLAQPNSCWPEVYEEGWCARRVLSNSPGHTGVCAGGRYQCADHDDDDDIHDDNDATPRRASLGSESDGAGASRSSRYNGDSLGESNVRRSSRPRKADHTPHNSSSTLFTCNSRGFVVCGEAHAGVAGAREPAARDTLGTTPFTTLSAKAMTHTRASNPQCEECLDVRSAHTRRVGMAPALSSSSLLSTAAGTWTSRPACPPSCAHRTSDVPDCFHHRRDARMERSCEEGVWGVPPRSYSATVRPPLSPGRTRSHCGSGGGRRRCGSSRSCSRSSNRTSMHRDDATLLQSENDENNVPASRCMKTPSPTPPRRCRRGMPQPSSLHRYRRSPGGLYCADRYACAPTVSHTNLNITTTQHYMGGDTYRSRSQTGHGLADGASSYTNPYHSCLTTNETAAAAAALPWCTRSSLTGCTHAWKDDAPPHARVRVCVVHECDKDSCHRRSEVKSARENTTHVPPSCMYEPLLTASCRADPVCTNRRTDNEGEEETWSCSHGSPSSSLASSSCVCGRWGCAPAHDTAPPSGRRVKKECTTAAAQTATRVVRTCAGVRYEVQPAVLRSFVTTLRVLAAHYEHPHSAQPPTWVRRRMEAMQLRYAIYGVRRCDRGAPTPRASSALSECASQQAVTDGGDPLSRCAATVFVLPLIEGGETCPVTWHDFPFFVQLVEQKAQELAHET